MFSLQPIVNQDRRRPQAILARMAVQAVLAAVIMASFADCARESVQAKKAWHRERALNYFEKGQYQEALIEFKNVIQLDPNDSDGHYRLALTYLKLGGLSDHQGAFNELTRTVQLDSYNYDAQLKLGQLYLLGNEPRKELPATTTDPGINECSSVAKRSTGIA